MKNDSSLHSQLSTFNSQLPKGYKQTEVGVIPEEWKSPTVRGLASSARNAIVGGPFGSDLVSRDYVEHGVPVIRGQNMSGQWVSGNFVFVTPAKAKSLEANLARPGDIVFTQRGTLGQVSLVPEKPFESYLVSQSQMKLSVNREVADPLFFFYVFTSEKQQELIRGGTIQTGVPHINLGILRGIPVQLPPLPEQRAIAGALSDVDALIGALDQLIAKKRDLKQAAMQQLLTGQKRLPGFHGEWEVKRVLELGEVVTGGTPRTDVEAFWGDGYPWITPTDISTHRDMFTSERTLTQKGLNAIRALPANTVLITCIASIGKNAILKTGGGCNQQINAVTPNKNNSAEFLYYVFEASKQYLLANAGTTATSIISKAAFEQLTFKVPPLTEQTAIAEVLSDMDAELAALTQRRDKTRALKQGMMQELLTGRIRLV